MYELEQQINQVVKDFLENYGATEVSAKEIGLDSRSGEHLFICQNFIAIKGSTQRLNYYGGFQYVDSDSVSTYGDYTFYSADDDRVAECISFYESELANEQRNQEIEEAMFE